MVETVVVAVVVGLVHSWVVAGAVVVLKREKRVVSVESLC